jgi:hypothetical protein
MKHAASKNVNLLHKEHSINRVDHAIAGLHVGSNNFCATDRYAAFSSEHDITALHGFDGACFDIGCHDFTGNDVVSQRFAQGIFVFEQRFSVSTKPAALTAVTRVVKFPAATAVSTMLCKVGVVGVEVVAMVMMRPFRVR